MSAGTAQRLAVGMLLLALAVVGLSAMVDVVERRSSPETVVRGYFAALQSGDVDAALAAITPEARAEWTLFVENGAFNTYRVSGVAVRQPSLLARLRGESGRPTDVTIFVEITQAV